jgi:hypothetical protein
MLPVLNSLKQYCSSLPPAELAAAKSQLFNIFRVNPWLTRFYLGSLDLLQANSNPFNNLPTRSENFSAPDHTPSNSEGSNSMPSNKSTRLCTHIKVNGSRCESPALRGEVFCYFHQRLFRGVRTPPQSRLHPMAFLEDEESIQTSLMEIVNALVRNTIDFRRAQLILRALHIATKNVPRTDFEVANYKGVVSEVPQYSAPADPPKPDPAFAQSRALSEIRPPKPNRITPAIDPTRRKPPASVTKTPITKASVISARAGSVPTRMPGRERSS